MDIFGNFSLAPLYVYIHSYTSLEGEKRWIPLLTKSLWKFICYYKNSSYGASRINILVK